MEIGYPGRIECRGMKKKFNHFSRSNVPRTSILVMGVDFQKTCSDMCGVTNLQEFSKSLQIDSMLSYCRGRSSKFPITLQGIGLR